MSGFLFSTLLPNFYNKKQEIEERFCNYIVRYITMVLIPPCGVLVIIKNHYGYL